MKTMTPKRDLPSLRGLRGGLTITLAACLVGPIPGQAQAAFHAAPADTVPADSATHEEAMRLRDLAEQRFFENDFEGALEAFEQAAALEPHPTDVYNMGRIREEMGELEAALALYEAFVSQPKVPLEERAAAAERIELLREVVEKVSPAEEDASEPEPTPEPRQGEFSDRALDDGHRKLVVTGATLVGLGAAVAIGGGVGFGIAARRSSDKIQDLSDGQNPSRLTLEEAENLEARGRDFETLQITSWVTGGVAVAIGTTLLAVGLHRRNRDRRRTARLEAIAPALTQRSFGLQTSWKF